VTAVVQKKKKTARAAAAATERVHGALEQWAKPVAKQSIDHSQHRVRVENEQRDGAERGLDDWLHSHARIGSGSPFHFEVYL
jgi:hypothetical protein